MMAPNPRVLPFDKASPLETQGEFRALVAAAMDDGLFGSFKETFAVRNDAISDPSYFTAREHPSTRYETVNSSALLGTKTPTVTAAPTAPLSLSATVDAPQDMI